MFDREIKKAISGHMARGNELMRENSEVMRENREVMRENREATTRTLEAIAEMRRELELARRDREDLTVFIRDITTRSERHADATVRAIDANTVTLTDMRADMAANRTAILSVIDRLEPPSGA